MTRAGLSLTVLLAAAGLLCLAAERASDSSDAAQTAGLLIGEPIREGNLTIFPVISKTPRLDDRFITLDEGLRAGTIEILEVSAAGAGGAPSSNVAANGSPSADPFAGPALNDSPTVRQDEDPFGAVQAASNQASPATEPVSDAQQLSQQDAVSLASQSQATINPTPGFYSGNDVNRLMVVNRSEKPLYLMPGEVIVGGDQDRTIGEELVIAPDKKPTPISVFCVEHGRWGSRDAQQYAGYLSADFAVAAPVITAAAFANPQQAAATTDHVEEIAKQANSGKFIGSIGSLNKGARLAVQKGDGQGEVWDQVSLQNAAAGVDPESGAFTANYADKDVAEQLERYQTRLQKPIAGTANVVGVIVAVNGKVESMDIFESTPLFTKLWPKLLKSYAFDALNSNDGDEARKQVTRADANYFMNEVAAARTQGTDRDESGLATVQSESDRVLLFTAHERRSDSEINRAAAISLDPTTDGEDQLFFPTYDGRNAGGGFGGGVHSSAFSK